MKKLFFIAVTALVFMSCKDSTTSASTDNKSSDSTMTDSQEAREERNKQTALTSTQVFANGGTVDEVLKEADKDAIDYGTGEMPEVKGVDSIKSGLKMWMTAVPDYKGTDLMAVADGDYVMVYGTWTGTWKNEFMGMKPTGKSFKVKDVDIFKFNDAGKIIEHRGVQSMGEISRQIGMQMPK